MEIINVNIDIKRNVRTFLFEDDISVDVDIDTNEIMDMDGIATVSEKRIKAIERRAGIIIQR